MWLKFKSLRRVVAVVGGCALLSLPAPLAGDEPPAYFPLRVVAANLTSGTRQQYETAGLNILRGLQPDIVALQEFNYSNNTPTNFRQMVDATWGTNFHYFRESSATEHYTIPNGIISRYPFLQTGTWDDPLIPDRGFAWARIDLPGTNDLFVVSVHLKANNQSAAIRASQALQLKNLIQASFPAHAWIIVAGDLNIHAPGEAALATFKTFLSDSPIPTDARTGGDPDTNAGRTARYDYVLPSFSLTNALADVVLPSHRFPNGLVFDSAVYHPLSDVAPVTPGDSHVNGMQHMAVVKDFRIPCAPAHPATPPVIVGQPADLTVPQAAAAQFHVTATGTAPLGYQWWFNGLPLAGATANSFTRDNVQPAHQGPYSVVVSNLAGSATSAPAVLRLLVPQPVLALSAPNHLTWHGLSNFTYTVETRTSLTDGDWQPLGNIASPAGLLSYPLPESSAPQQFFRVVWP